MNMLTSSSGDIRSALQQDMFDAKGCETPQEAQSDQFASWRRLLTREQFAQLFGATESEHKAFASPIKSRPPNVVFDLYDAISEKPVFESLGNELRKVAEGGFNINGLVGNIKRALKAKRSPITLIDTEGNLYEFDQNGCCQCVDQKGKILHRDRQAKDFSQDPARYAMSLFMRGKLAGAVVGIDTYGCGDQVQKEYYRHRPYVVTQANLVDGRENFSHISLQPPFEILQNAA